MSKTIPLSDEHNEHDDPADSFEREIKQRLKNEGYSDKWMQDHLIIDFPDA